MGDYPLDLLSPVRHVATELGRVSPEALPLSGLAATYQHPNTGDLARVRREHGFSGNDDARLWLIGKAVEELGKQVEENGSGYRLADGYGLVKGDGVKPILYPGRNHLHGYHDPHVILRNPFDPMTGRFSDNVRRNTGKDGMEELRESMRSFGWLKEFPAIKDERGVVLVGHRRLAVATELGIEPVVKPVRLGDGDEADAKRFALAVASNLGSKPFTPEERKDLAEYLYGEREWTMQRIADALNVSVGTVSGDLREFSTSENPKIKSRGGRPKGSTKIKATPELEAEVRQLVDSGQAVPRAELAKKHGVGDKTVQLAHQRAIGAIEERGKSASSEARTPGTAGTAEHEHRWVCADCGNVAPSDS